MKLSSCCLVLLALITSPLYASDLFILHNGLPEGSDREKIFSYQVSANGTDGEGSHIAVSVTQRFQANESGQINGISGLRIKTETTTDVKGQGISRELSYHKKTTSYEYADCDTNGCKYLGSITADDEFSLPLQVFNVPFKARIGDSGIVGTYQDEEGIISSCLWALLQAEQNDHADLTVSCTETEGITIQSRETNTMTIDQSGRCLKTSFTSQELDDDGLVELDGQMSCPQDTYFLRFL